jgi:sugar O-acyltransferase (sialic acid O-acetyltransferase NeuD family)
MKIAIYGAGGLGREVLALIRQINLVSRACEIIGFFDDSLPKGQVVNGLTVLGGIADLNGWGEDLNVVLAIGEPKAKKLSFERINNKFVHFPILIYPSVQIEEFQNVIIGDGSIITAGNILTTDIRIGSHVLVNLDCTIGHDVVIGDYTSVMPGVHISGKVKIGEGAYLGSGAVIINNINIGDMSVIGAGAVVIRDVEAMTTVVGVPAKVNIENKVWKL